MNRFYEPMRRIVSIDVGAGSDVLHLDCGHAVTRTHRAKWGEKTRCAGEGCREWLNPPERSDD